MYKEIVPCIPNNTGLSRTHDLPMGPRPSLHVFVAWLFALCIMVQALLAGLSIFADPGWWAIHVEAGRWFNAIPICFCFVFLVYCLAEWLTLSPVGGAGGP